MHGSAPKRGGNFGFSLIQVSILLTVAALVVVSMLPGQEAGDVNRNRAATIEPLMKIEQMNVPSCRAEQAKKSRQSPPGPTKQSKEG